MRSENNPPARPSLKIRRALMTVSDKSGIVELAQALAQSGTEIVATGKTARVLKDAGLEIIPIERVSGSPEAFQGRMKTLSFPVCSGILYRRGDASDEKDLASLSIPAIDCVVVNFYPFEQAQARDGISDAELIEEVDIGGPTLVRAAAKNVPHVLVLTHPAQYGPVISDLKAFGSVSHDWVKNCAKSAWERILGYDQAIAARLGNSGSRRRNLRYGENPHQRGFLVFDEDSPIDWGSQLTNAELSYNNILDLSSAYHLISDLRTIDPKSASVAIIKHNNPCGVAMIPLTASGSRAAAQLEALQRAWEGDPVSAFGGVVAFSDALEPETASWLSERFIELVAAPGLKDAREILSSMGSRRKNLKAVSIRRYGEIPEETSVNVPGGKLFQSADRGTDETLRLVTKKPLPEGAEKLSRFGIAVCRALKSNAIALVREVPEIPGSAQLAGAGQGQPNRIDSLKILAVPRARAMGADLGQCVMVSDAFFPFRDTVDSAFEAGIRSIIQPGGSLKDSESIAACDQHGMAMVFTGVRHFKH